MSPIPTYVCHVSFLRTAASHFGNAKKPLLLVMPKASTIYELRRAVEKETGFSTKGFQIRSPNGLLNDKDKIFSQPDAIQSYPILAFAFGDGMVLYIKSPLHSRMLALFVTEDDTINIVKAKIQDSGGLPQRESHLTYKGKQLDDSKIVQAWLLGQN
jgi:hypothetical protein